MRRRFLVAILFIGLTAACGSGGDGPSDPKFDFSGKWEIDIQSVENTYPGGDDEAAWSTEMDIDQDGNRINISLSSMDLEGSCDPEKGTFEADYHHPDAVITLTGAFAADGLTLEGTYYDQSLKDDDDHIQATWTARRQ